MRRILSVTDMNDDQRNRLFVAVAILKGIMAENQVDSIIHGGG